VISEAEALARILADVEPLPAESLPVAQAAGHFAAQAVHAPAPLPRFDQSAMDGYALRAADTPGALRIVGEQPAGRARDLRVEGGEAVRIFTGAPMPRGADAVVMQEDVEAAGDIVRVPEAIPPGEFVRRRGDDVCAGQLLLAPGEPITAARIGLLCAAGLLEIRAGRRPRIGIVTSGDELRLPGEPLAPGELYQSNGPMLAAQLANRAEILGAAHAPDDPAAVAAAISGFAAADAVVLSAGVSVGAHDPVHEALRQLGAEVALWRVAIRPGKPFLLARLGAQWIFGLPGNPVSTFVTAHLYVRPALARLAGAEASFATPARVRIPLGAPVANTDSRPHYIRATQRDGVAFPAPAQQSHALASLAAADLLLRLEPGAHLDAGALIDAFPLNFC
jgi:molybdopterin molybdotransferase